VLDFMTNAWVLTYSDGDSAFHKWGFTAGSTGTAKEATIRVLWRIASTPARTTTDLNGSTDNV